MFKKFEKVVKLTYALVSPSNSYKDWENRDSNMASKGYLVSINSETNDFLYEYIEKLNYSTLLEVGSNVGNRIIKLALNNPTKEFYGIDINRSAIDLGIEYLRSNRIGNMNLYCLNLVKIGDEKFYSDIVVTWATLIYISPREIKKAINNLAKMSRDYLILVEKVIENNDSILSRIKIQLKGFPNWSYNYEALLKIHGFALMLSDPIPDSIWMPGGGGAKIQIFKKI